jgi:hypothetical protein
MMMATGRAKSSTLATAYLRRRLERILALEQEGESLRMMTAEPGGPYSLSSLSFVRLYTLERAKQFNRTKTEGIQFFSPCFVLVRPPPAPTILQPRQEENSLIIQPNDGQDLEHLLPSLSSSSSSSSSPSPALDPPRLGRPEAARGSLSRQQGKSRLEESRRGLKEGAEDRRWKSGRSEGVGRRRGGGRRHEVGR